MAALNFPNAPFRPEDVADWLELAAIDAADKDASAGDIERELNRLGCGDPDTKIGNAFTEIDRREKATGGSGYPFNRGNSSIKLKGEARDFPAYVFCLALSYYQWKARKGAPENPWELFEQLAYYSAKHYLGGEAHVFGTSGNEGDKGKRRFVEDINALAKKLGEGHGFKKQRTFSTKDSKLDIVAWKPFPDGRPSQVVLFGQCASGENWPAKLTELDPEAFWDTWMSAGKVSSPLRSVFMPHRVFDEEHWRQRATRARLLFDRCRVVAFAHKDTGGGKFADRLLACCRSEWQLKV
jgi:hypothetical protein